jgi:hypothetical protein
MGAATFLMVLLFVLIVSVAHVFACERRTRGPAVGGSADYDITKYIVAFG